MEATVTRRLSKHVGRRWRLICDAWNRFWYQPDDPIAICLLRIVTGLVLLYTLAVWTLDLSAFFGNRIGWQAERLVSQLQADQWAFSFWWFVPDGYLWLAHAVCIAVVLALTIGLWTQVTKFATFVICISYANRIPMAHFGLDQVTAAWLLYLCLSPCGARLSVDQWLRRRRNPSAEKQPPPDLKCSAARLTMRMVQVHLCVIYFWAGVSKLQGESWMSGEAIWWIASNYEHQHASMTWLAYVPWLYQILTIGTWVWEVAFPFLIWNRWLRLPMLIVGIGMHAGIGIFLGLWPFALIMICGYISFVPTAMLNQWLETLTIAMRRRQTPLEAAIVDQPPPTVVLPVASAVATEPEPLRETTNFPSQLALSTSPNQDAIPCVDRNDAFALNEANHLNSDHATHKQAGAIAITPRVVRRIKKVKPMFVENDRDNMVLFVERSARRRCSLIRALEDYGYRCIGLDAWPETIEVYNVLKPRCIMCNGYRTPASELRFWRSQLDEREDSVFVVLVEPQYVSQITSDDGRTVGVAVPASFEQICAALDGTGRPSGGDPPPRPIAAPDDAGDDQADQIFSLSTRNRPR
ncbi:MAG: HTTM domain-containing protein [Pirellulaceae bacterium]